jgi:ATP-dependent DNA helicase RecG
MYKISVTKDTQRIQVETGDVYPFQSMEGFATSESGCEIDFNKANALLIRGFMAGKPFSIDERSKNMLKFIADVDIKDVVTWSSTLINLNDVKVTKKFGSIKTEWDLLHYLPLRYIDKSNPQNVKDLELGQWAVVIGTIVNEPKYDYARNIVKIVVQDVAKNRISATFFRQKWLAFQYKEGDEVVMYGNYSEYVNHKGGRFPQLSNAKLDKLTNVRGSMPMVPIYPQKSGDKSWQIQKAIQAMLEGIVWLEDPVPPHIIDKYGLMSRNEAYRKVHFPSNQNDADRARERIAFDEFVRLQVVLYNKRAEIESFKSLPKNNLTMTQDFIKNLPYSLTGAQDRVIKEILADMSDETPMHRLVQGDVGSGKTSVGAASLLASVGSGYQAALLAPTDILATQLFEGIQEQLSLSGINVSMRIMTGKTTAKNKTEILSGIKDGSIQALVGTHALIQDNVEFDNLGILIVDEQHKFGAEQRSKLRVPNRDGYLPDVLIMTATPIPRTTAQVIYGDMDISIIDELPAGRKNIDTFWVASPEDAWTAIHEELAKGHQAYIITPMVEENLESNIDIENAVSTFEESQKRFSDYNVGLVHGKLKASEKDAVMKSFKNNEIQVLVSTTVVEVGVNVPNATVMVILNSNRFGIASLHQMRGRVGRSDKQSYCYLVGTATTPEAEERLNAMVASNDGFYLAEKDLEIRGEGKLFGSNQSGINDLFIANLREHKHILDIAKVVAKAASSSEQLQSEIEQIFVQKDVLT